MKRNKTSIWAVWSTRNGIIFDKTNISQQEVQGHAKEWFLARYQR